MEKTWRSTFLPLALATTLTLTFGCASPEATDKSAAVGEGPESLSLRPNDGVAHVLKEHEKKQEPAATVAVEKTETKRTARDIEALTIGEVIATEEPNTATLYDNSRYDFPITVNSRVEGWIDYFTGRGRGHMERYLGRSSRYIPGMKTVLKEAGIPEDLVYLALIESGFNLRAKSRAKAVGPWQFMKATGKRYGLRVDSWVDERRDPIRSTQAAANYLKDLYLMFESWYLAASAYNAGEYKILRAIDGLKTNNYWRISDSKMIRRETKDYIPKLIAAAIIAKNPAKYGFEDVAYLEPLEFESIKVDFALPLAKISKILDIPEDDILDLNPHYAKHMIPPTGGPYELRVPTGTRTLVEGALGNMRRNLAQVDLPLQHTVRAGDTIKSVSKKYRIAPAILAGANSIGVRERLTPGETLIIPERTGAVVGPATQGNVTPPTPAKSKRSVSSLGPQKTADGFVFHTVRKGESLWEISESYNVTVQQIFRWNSLKRSQIFPGMKLKVKPQEASEES